MSIRDELTRREFELRRQWSSDRFAKCQTSADAMGAVGAAFDAASFSHVLGEANEVQRWFRLAAEGGSLDYALFALDFQRAGQILASVAEPPTEPSAALKWHLARRDAAGVKEIARRQSGAKQEGSIEAVVEAALGIVEGNAGRLTKGLNEILVRHTRACSRGKSRFNSSHAFMSHQASALAVLGGAWGVPAEIEPKFRPARVPILFIAVDGPLKSPPSHVEVDLVPEAYRTPHAAHVLP